MKIQVAILSFSLEIQTTFNSKVYSNDFLVCKSYAKAEAKTPYRKLRGRNDSWVALFFGTFNSVNNLKVLLTFDDVFLCSICIGSIMVFSPGSGML